MHGETVRQKHLRERWLSNAHAFVNGYADHTEVISNFISIVSLYPFTSFLLILGDQNAGLHLAIPDCLQNVARAYAWKVGLSATF